MLELNLSEVLVSKIDLRVKESNTKFLTGRKILLIEDDYVNYMMLRELIDCSGGYVQRAVSFDDAVCGLSSNGNFDLIIINKSLSCGVCNDMIKYLKQEFLVPVVVSDSNINQEKINCNSKLQSADCVVCLHSDFEHFYETIVAALK